MSQTKPRKSSKSPSPDGKAFQRKGFQFLGLGRQDFIRVFFGGNASLAIVILILICVFLLREAVMFFPDHHAGLKSYRKSGQEFVDHFDKQIVAHTNLYSSVNIAYYAEVNRTSEVEDAILRAYRSVLANVENITKTTWGRLEREIDRADDVRDDVEDLEDDLGDLDPDAEGDREKIAEVEETLAEAKNELAVLEDKIATLRPELKKEVDAAIETEAAWDLGIGGGRIPGEARPRVREAVIFEAYPDADEEHPYIEALKETSKEKKGAAAEELVEFKATVKGIQDAIRPMKDTVREMRDIASGNKREIVSFSTAGARRDAWLEGASKAADPDEKARMLKNAEEVDIVEPDYDAINEPLYPFKEKYVELAAPLELEMAKLMAALPGKDDVLTKSARVNLDRAETFYRRLDSKMDKNADKIRDWRHDKSLSAPESVSAFLFGKDWITNSSWHDFYGLLPLFTGSFLIAIIALVVAVPFAVFSAVYVNQLASSREQNLVKPAIEFIGAIPSVVLGFFGILVLGEALRNVSQVEWLQWVPGFPMAQRLNILNAGLLLAFMAVPTIFTLTEDALNNVPQAFTENSLAMGASKLQTVFRVVVPTAVSGIIAAILLGFGRIIGETMVVLLVAGNKIKIPDFTEGLGVIAQPAHTMTGIIAQELGEVDSGSLHWRALFMVGMVLFVISLLVNFMAQRVLKRLQKI